MRHAAIGLEGCLMVAGSGEIGEHLLAWGADGIGGESGRCHFAR